VRDFRRHIGEAAFIEIENLVADPNFKSAFQNVNRLFL